PSQPQATEFFRLSESAARQINQDFISHALRQLLLIFQKLSTAVDSSAQHVTRHYVLIEGITLRRSLGGSIFAKSEFVGRSWPSYPRSSSASTRSAAPSRSSYWPARIDHRNAARPVRPRVRAIGTR